MTTIVSTKGQIVLPAEIRERDGIEPGQQFDIERIDCGEYRLVRRLPRPNEGLVDWLLACPEKDFFIPIQSESTCCPKANAAIAWSTGLS
jgi:AbrB family looped-hinge helix DNA binding protein